MFKSKGKPLFKKNPSLLVVLIAGSATTALALGGRSNVDGFKRSGHHTSR